MQLRHRPKRLIAHAIAGLLALSLSLTHATVQAEEFSEDNLLLLDFKLGRTILGQSVTAYSLNNTIVISLAEASAALEFPIEVDADNGTASGWFLSKDRKFELDINTRTVTIEGISQPLKPSDAISHEYAIYVPLKVFSHWFPADLTLQLTSMAINVEPREPLPSQLRAQRRQQAGKRFVMSPPELPNITTPYRLIGPPIADVSLSYFVRRDTEPQITSATTSWNHSTLLRGDLAYMSSSIYLSGNKDKEVQTARMTLSRDKPYTPSGISRIEVGDILPPSLPGVPQYSMERGIQVQGSSHSDTDLYSPDGNKTRISGDILQGWEVELLHNGIRVDYQIIDVEGRYDFRDLILYTGANTFELLFYGPAGERRTETITRYGGSDAIHAGNLSYQLSASQQNKPLYEQEIDTTIATTDLGTGRYTASLGYGISPNLSVNSTWNSIVTDGTRLNYYGAGFQTDWRFVTLGLSGTKDPLGGTIWDAVINTPYTMRLWGFQTQLQHTQYADSVIATDPNTQTKLTSLSRVILTGKIKSISTRFAATHNRQLNLSTTSYGLDLSTKVGNSRVGNSLSSLVYQDPKEPNKPSGLTGTLYFDSKLFPLLVRGAYNYRLQPERESLQYSLTSDLNIAHDMSMYFGLEYRAVTKVSRYTAGMSWLLKHVTLSPRIIYDSNDTYLGFISATFSLSPKPERSGVLFSGKSMAQSGAVASRVFNDIDGDGKFSAGDKPIPNATVYATQLFRNVDTDEHGTAYLTGLHPGRASDIRLDQESLPDTTMISRHLGNSVQPRPAHWDIIDFPVIITGEIDGKLLQRGDDNMLKPQPGMVVELRDTNNELVDFKISSYDGFFVFEHIPHGQYTITLTAKYKDILTHPAPSVELNENAPDHSGLELIVKAQQAPVTGSFFPKGNEAAIILTVPESVAPEISTPLSSIALPLPTETSLPPITYRLQLGAFGSQASADAAIALLLQRHNSDLLQGLELRVERSNQDARGIFYRVQATGKLDATTAKALCQQFKQRRQNCVVVTKKITTPP